jgi:hypothetical protein
MRQAATFDDMLRERLCSQPVEPVATAPRLEFRPAPVLGFFAFSPETGVRRLGYTQSAVPLHARIAAQQVPLRPAAPRRVLSTAQEQALAAFNELGASLGSDFTATELRAAFRSLARRYHPDRHPGTNDTQRSHLATLFAQAHSAYKHLKIALPAA